MMSRSNFKATYIIRTAVKIKHIYALLGALLFNISPVIAQSHTPIQFPGNRVEVRLTTDWTFNYFPEGSNATDNKYPGFNDERWNQPDAAIWETIIEHPKFNDSGWSAVAVPHTWSTYETTGEIHPYIKNPSPKDDPYWWNGLGWYRKKFIIENKYADKKVFVEFEGVQKNCRVYINGKIVGEHFGGYTGFSVDLTDYINFGGINVLVVSVSNRQIDDFKVAPMDGGCWNVYGGIYRPVKLVLTNKIYVPYQGSHKFEGGTFITTPDVSEQKADVRVRTWVKNEYNEPKQCTLNTILVDKNGQVVSEISETKIINSGYNQSFDQTTILKNPLLWDVDHPNMYQAISRVIIDSELADEFKSSFGIREFRWDFDTNRLYLNGKMVNLQGFNRHQEYPWLGDAIPDFIHEMDLKDIKENLNCTFIRPGQYITAPYVYDLCDRLGLITCGEFPFVKDRDFTYEFQEQYAREVVRQYRNHPSIFLWDVGDETNRSADSQWVREEDAIRYITCRHDPSQSPGKYINLTSEDLRLAKMLRCNVRGWYDDDEKNFRPENQQHTSNEQYRHEIARISPQGTTSDRIDQPNLIVWLYEDHGCDREYQNAPVLHYNPKGWVDNYRVPKFVYYLWQANYSRQPMIFIHPQFWRPQYIGQKKDIEIDSNCESVELFVNGKSAGILKPDAGNFHVVKFRNIQIEPGVLTVKGIKNGRLFSKDLRMAGPPAKLKLTTSHKQMEARRNSVAIITADITDLNDEHVYGARNTITWEISGPATLVGASVYESDFDKNMDMEGSLYIDMPVSNVIRSTGLPGIITVRAFAAGLRMGEVKINATAKPIESEDIIQPSLSPEGRLPVQKNPKQNKESLTVIPQLLKDYTTGVTFPGGSISSYERKLDHLLDQKNKVNVQKSNEYLALRNVLARELENSQGSLPAKEINFNIHNFNRCAYINQVIDQTNLHDRIKSDLKTFYIIEMITNANFRNVTEVVKHISALPSVGAKVVISGAPADKTENGIFYTTSEDIYEIVSIANKNFRELNPTDQESYLNKLATMNPWIKRSVYWTGDSKKNTKKEVISYFVENGKALLVPEISDNTISNN